MLFEFIYKLGLFKFVKPAFINAVAALVKLALALLRMPWEKPTNKRSNFSW